MIERLRFRHITGIVFSILCAAALSAAPLAFQFEGARDEARSVTVFFVFVLAFLMNNSMQKSQKLVENINLELSRLRRLHHLVETASKNKVDTRLRKGIETGLREYRQILVRGGMKLYEDAHEPFRMITHAVYEYQPRNERGRILLGELFTTTRELAAVRQSIVSHLHHRISSYGWTVLLCTEAFVVIAILVTQGTGAVPFLASFSILAIIFMLTLFVHEIDTYSRRQLRDFGLRYHKRRGVEHA